MQSPATVTTDDNGIFSSRFEVDSDTDFDGTGHIFTVNAAEHNLQTPWLAFDFFITSETDAVGRLLYIQPNMS
jgi:hypothetical protein